MTELSYFPFFQRIHMKIIQKTFPAYSFYFQTAVSRMTFSLAQDPFVYCFFWRQFLCFCF